MDVMSNNKTMKNIHILPTDKPSRLSKDENDRIWLSINFEYGINDNNKQNIYITNDEEIKIGDWIFDLDVKRIVKADNLKVLTSKAIGCWYYKKIILTTDQDLIKYGVQAIDDEFLEWFVKNPSCEEVEVVNGTFTVGEMSKLPLGTRNLKYKIIIPKKEPKQIKCYCGHTDYCDCGPLEEPKQETLEEAAKGYSERHQDVSGNLGKYLVSAVFQDGAKWQQERMYSEEDMFEFSQWISHEDWVYLPSKGYWVNEEQEELEQKLNSKEILNMWFEKFKKK